jgi:hypothetical protein
VGWLTGRRQPLILNPYDTLTRRSRAIAALALVIFVVCFMPVPVEVIGL